MWTLIIAAAGPNGWQAYGRLLLLLSELSVPTKVALLSILDEFLILNANVT